MKLEYLSASRISTFLQCPMKYHAVYELEMRDVTKHPLVVMGSAVHKIMELSTRARMLGHDWLRDPVNIAESVFCKYKVESNLWDLGIKLVQNAVEWGYFDNISHTIGCELECMGELSDGILYKGIIDRLDIRGRYANIIDLKTQKRLFSKAKLNKNWQAMIYDLAIRDKYPQVENVTVSFWVLRHKIQEVSFDVAQSVINRSMLEEKVKQIRECESPVCKSSPLCQWCPYDIKCSKQEESIKERLGWR